MKRAVLLMFIVSFPAGSVAQELTRPSILGIVQVRIAVSDKQKAEAFYYGVLRTIAPPAKAGTECNWCEGVPSRGPGPFEFDTFHGQPPADLLSAVTFRTTDAKALREFLIQDKVKVGKLNVLPSGAEFTALDPEMHRLIFIQGEATMPEISGMPGVHPYRTASWPPIIHAGFVVRDRAAADGFYKDILGFRLYWHGGMKEAETDWVAMQVPDGTDWVEYMLKVPQDTDKRELGVMNQFSLGVESVEEADRKLKKAGIILTEEPKIGRDGKWQLNLYDPDLTRVELIEFTPVEKPCCAEFTGTHPKP